MNNIKLDLSPLFKRIQAELEDQVQSVIVPGVVPELSKALSEEVDKFVYQVQEKIVKARTPVRTGKLRESIVLVVDHRSTKSLVIRGYAGPPSKKGIPYAASIEFGARPHHIPKSPTPGVWISFVGKKAVPAKKWQHKSVQHYAKKATSNVIRNQVYVAGFNKFEMFQSGLDFIYQNIATVLANKLQTVDFTKFRFTPGGRGKSLHGPSPIVMRSSHKPTSNTSIGSLHATMDVDIEPNMQDLQDLKDEGF
jgi:hypothetical protein